MKHTINALLFCGAFLLTGAAQAAPVQSGLDVLKESGFAALSGKRVGIITNHTGVDFQGNRLANLLLDRSSATLAAIFSPEHGFTGAAAHGQNIADSSYRGVPIYSLYGEHKRPAAEQLAGLDVLVFDIQDVGVRFYTYTATMAMAQEEADRAGIEFMVLDRPNPVTGTIVEGATLDDGISTLTAYLKTTLRHGMTPGELALLHAKTMALRRKPAVIRMKGWKRAMWQDQTGLAWIPPSPNLKTPLAAELYPGIACFEASNLSVGRGTDTPFEWFGAPWLDAQKLLNSLKKMLPGVKLHAENRTPASDKYTGENCAGIGITVTDRNACRPVTLFVKLFFALRQTQGEAFRPECRGLERMTGIKDFCGWVDGGATEAQVLARFEAGAAAFRQERTAFLLY